ncbi:alpha/beta-hydrolase [Microthyrium microscopicum]|uniref:Carboxylic ester hydrolase n=1 Tax=Microthyrium microscopicum TaxID=703497 RepID=A0A6A6U1K5_9PEZI|nr:alpha/beta-hydrolase [Microthyrium microscopicum]
MLLLVSSTLANSNDVQGNSTEKVVYDDAYRAWFFSPEQRLKRTRAWEANHGISPRNHPVYNPLEPRKEAIDCGQWSCSNGEDGQCRHASEHSRECDLCPALIGETKPCMKNPNNYCHGVNATTTAAQTEWKVGQQVLTTSGPVVGHSPILKGNTEVSEYLGIPYAQPPIGKLRWRVPQTYKSPNNATIKATQWGPSCPSGGMTGGSNVNEDCLTLNIWTKPQTGEKKKAVLISIYGGGFNIGSSNTPSLNGAPLANQQDVVVVSMNYRLNVFGFPGAPGIFPEQNFGLRDIRQSIEWTRDNIAAFGGDPSRMIIMGESAGGGAVDFYSFAYPEDPIVHGFIEQSGSAWTRGIAEDSNLDVWYKMSAKLGCGGQEAGVKTIDCLREKPWKDVMALVQTGPRTPGETFGPIFDEQTIFKDYDARAKAGNFSKKPLLIGSNNNEAGTFEMMAGLNAKDVSDMNRLFTCLAAKSADARLSFKVPTWRYRFFDASPNNAISAKSGAFHGAELAFVFGTPKSRDNFLGVNTDTPAEAQLTQKMMTAWAAFAKDPVGGLDKLGYSRYIPESKSLIQFGVPGAEAVSYDVGKKFDDECAIYEKSTDSIHDIIGRAKARRAGPKKAPELMSRL